MAFNSGPAKGERFGNPKDVGLPSFDACLGYLFANCFRICEGTGTVLNFHKYPNFGEKKVGMEKNVITNPQVEAPKPCLSETCSSCGPAKARWMDATCATAPAISRSLRTLASCFIRSKAALRSSRRVSPVNWKHERHHPLAFRHPPTHERI